MNEIEQLNDYCDARGLLCQKCRWTAQIILRLLGLSRAKAFVDRQRPH